MKSLKKILVVLDPNSDSQPALDKGLYLAKQYQASIELLMVTYNRGLASNLLFDPERFEAAKKGYLNSQKRWLDSYVNQVTDAGITCATQIIWHKPLYEGIIQSAKAINADLIVKSTHPHPTLNKLLFTPNDWQLIKLSEVPVLLAKASPQAGYGKILAAIDPSKAHDKPETLDPLIIETALNVSTKLGCECHVAHCFEPIGYQLWNDIGIGMGVGMGPADFSMGEDNYNDYIEKLSEIQRKHFDEAIAKYGFSQSCQHLEEGYPQEILIELVKKLSISLLVLGNCYHSGLVGSTTEKILDDVNCDVLSVRLEKS